MDNISDEFIDNLIETYFTLAIKELNKSKYKNQADYKNLIYDFYQVKIDLYEYVNKKVGLYINSNELLNAIDQVCIIAFFGIGLKDSLEKHIVNNGLFWGLFAFNISRNEFPSFQLQLISESVNRYERLKSTELLKQMAFIVVNFCDDILIESLKSIGVFDENFTCKQFKRFKSQSNDFLKHANNRLESATKKIKKNIDSEGNILVYRGFDFGPKDSVRKKGFKKKGNKDAHIQETGVGLSFTLDKEIAKEFALSKWNAMNNNQITWGIRISNNALILKKTGIDLQKFTTDKERYAAIGTYKVRAKKIIVNLAFDNNYAKSESEVMILPENLELISYRIIRGTRKNNLLI
jgi:hypothetical protein